MSKISLGALWAGNKAQGQSFPLAKTVLGSLSFDKKSWDLNRDGS